ncbi:TIGR01459 family HAD-type hydrolase [Parvularcula dongshanensis]|uniref:HAD superfamily hydrolase (TIGR01459 family) n=1 Tax=Parvularcula dongshanensis TaxID=1173995 RepID=A0A840I3M7_9PROT|nr:TIGR01459 family HAD-type hydrolase [Parvularcula dongshanensis]MBB4658814.1 HAD superfamily hydrolase (TIGR01459 family) [Parvularcula dongshanensis]
MSQTRVIEGLSEAEAGYDALFCDAWGVIHNGHDLFPGAADALSRWRDERGPVVIITNAPRLSDVIPAQLDRLGLPRSAYDAIVTSGDATRAEVERRADLPFFRLGPAKDDGLFDAVRADFVSFEEAGAILCTGPMDDLNETPEDYRGMLEKAASRKLPMVCANPDKVVRYGDRLIYCAGALGDLYESLGGEVILAGKPHAPIYRMAREAALASGRAADRPLVVGDGPETDLRGANREGLDAVFVADGIFSEEARGRNGKLDEGRLAAILDAHDVTAAYGMDGLRW